MRSREFPVTSYRRELEDLVHASVDLHGRIDILVCNAGIAPHMGPIASASDVDWDSTMTVNLRSVLWLTTLVIPGMAERRDGSVIIVSSIAGVRGNRALGLYGLSKAGSAQLAATSRWRGPSNVRVKAISPGVIETQFASPMLSDTGVMERRIALTPCAARASRAKSQGRAATRFAGRCVHDRSERDVDGGTTIGD